MNKKAVWFSDNDNYIIDFVKNSKTSFSGSIKDLLHYAIDLKKKNVVLDQNGNVCIMSRINDNLVQSEKDQIKDSKLEKIDVSGLI